MKFQPRTCPVCLSGDREVIFHQTFSAFSEGSLMEGYDLSLCTACGAAYADDIPDQRVFDTYYAEMSKYEYAQRSGEPSKSDRERFEEMVGIASEYVAKDAFIADVGCATGGLLAEFKRRGFSNLIGFDPSPACAEAAHRLYGLKVIAASIHDLDSKVEKRFDAIALTGVLEHLRDVDESLEKLSGILNPTGSLYVEVPDASRYFEWFSAPYQFFSMEHVNFFSPASLANLLSRHGYDCLHSRRVKRYLSPRAVEPAIAAVFRRRPDSQAGPPAFDAETKPTILRYITESASLEKRVQEKITALAQGKRPLAVWGAGTHTLRLLETSDLPKANLIAFLDSNVRYQGKTLHDVPILAPAQFTDRSADILISSHVAEPEIAATIKNQLKWENPVIRLYGDAPLEFTTAICG